MKRALLLAAALASVGFAAPAGDALARDGDPGRRVERQDRREPRAPDERRVRGRRDGAEGPGPVRSFAPSGRRVAAPPEPFADGIVRDYPRYRLRTPPQGYAWVRLGDGFALISLEDGRIYDRVR